jgi:hypothetical protein
MDQTPSQLLKSLNVLKWILDMIGMYRLDWRTPMEAYCNEHSVSIKYWEILEWLNDCRLLKNSGIGSEWMVFPEHWTVRKCDKMHGVALSGERWKEKRQRVSESTSISCNRDLCDLLHHTQYRDFEEKEYDYFIRNSIMAAMCFNGFQNCW